MKKIPSLFVRDYATRKVTSQVTPGSEWVLVGEGVATRKWDGIAVLVEKGEVFKRYDAKNGKAPPENFRPAQPAPDPHTGHWPGWVPAVGPASKYVLEAVRRAKEEKNPMGFFPNGVIPDGTYEVCSLFNTARLFSMTLDGTYEVCDPASGTQHGSNPENLMEHVLIPHGRHVLYDIPLTFEGVKEYLRHKAGMEGIVWHHPDGRMVKIKRSDFDFS